MLNKIFGILCIASIAGAFRFGTIEEVAAGAVSGASGAVTVTIALIGMMCLWCGIMRVAEELGALRVLSGLLSPIMKRVFPDAWKRQHGVEEISAAIAANILGIGNAATPLALQAMRALRDNQISAGDESGRASDDMVTFTVLGTASFDIIPTTIISLRSAAGSVNPFEIIVPVWIASLGCAVLAVVVSRIPSMSRRKGKRKNKLRRLS